MVRLHDGGAYIIREQEIIPESGASAARIADAYGKAVSKEEAKQNTMAYGILQEHNTSQDPAKLKIKFDKLTSHDITFVGIIQTARLCADQLS